MSKSIDINKLSGKMKILYDKYPLTTHKFRKLYYESKVYRNLIDFLCGVIPNNLLYPKYKGIINYLECMPSTTYEMLCELERINKLDDLISLIKMSAK